MPNPVTYNGYAMAIGGTIDGPSSAQTVSIYERAAGSSAETLIGTTSATAYDGSLVFEFPLMQSFTTNTVFRVHVDGSGSSTAADQSLTLGVQAKVSLKSSASKVTRGKSVKLTASVFPASAAGGTVLFQQQSGKSWKTLATKKLAGSGSSAVASTSYKVSAGSHKLRLRYLGGTYNVATTSGTLSVTGR